MKNNWPYLLIAISAALWGLIAIFVQGLRSYGFSPIQIVTIRAISAGILLLIYVLIKDHTLLKIKAKDIKYFLATGLLSIVFFNWAYFTAIQEISLSLAVVLLYTSPAFVAIISRFVFKEQLSSKKVIALMIMLIGSSLVVGLLPSLDIAISWYGLLIGLGSGLGYALYSIFGKLASYKYSSTTITTYTFLFASAALIPFSGLWEVKEVFCQSEVMLLSIGLGLFPSALAYILYTVGLTKVETSRAAIMANIEPVVAMIVGIFYFGDMLTAWQLLGGIMVLSATILVQEQKVKSTIY